jgi:large subunit ribosomal protein L10
MLKSEKERIVTELTDRLRASESLIIADYRGLSVGEVDELRTRLLEAGARFSVVKNTLTRLAAEAAGTTELLQFVDGPTAIAFVQPDGDPVAVAKVLSESARTGRVLVIRGGLFEGRPVSDAEVEDLAKLPAIDILRGQVLGAIVGPLNAIAALVNAPLQELVGLIDARIEQLGGEAPEEPSAETAPEPEPAVEPVPEAAEAEEPKPRAAAERERTEPEEPAAEAEDNQSSEAADATPGELEEE